MVWRWVHQGLEVGWSGVDLFFVLSGFLIGGILLDHRQARNYYSTFFIRRACRILPLYLALLTPLFLGIAFHDRIPKLAEAASSGEISPISHLCFVQNIEMALRASFGERWIATTWSLAVEEQFYLLAPFIVRRISHQSLFRLALVLAIGSPILRTLLFFTLPSYQAHVATYVLLPCRWDALFFGVLVAVAWRNPRWIEQIRTSRRFLMALLSTFAIGSLALALFSPEFGSTAMVTVGHTILSAFFALLLLVALVFRPTWTRLLEWKILGGAGLISYGLYLFHEPIISVMFRFVFHRDRNITDPMDVAVALASIATTAIVATLSWLLFERGFLRIGHRFRYETGSGGESEIR